MYKNENIKSKFSISGLISEFVFWLSRAQRALLMEEEATFDPVGNNPVIQNSQRVSFSRVKYWASGMFHLCFWLVLFYGARIWFTPFSRTSGPVGLKVWYPISCNSILFLPPPQMCAVNALPIYSLFLHFWIADHLQSVQEMKRMMQWMARCL